MADAPVVPPVVAPPKPKQYKLLIGKHYIGDQIVRSGAIVALNEKQALAFKDKFEEVK